jgi:VIT1/CCC1 family predicted Fe2+/Mn2+ transporter
MTVLGRILKSLGLKRRATALLVVLLNVAKTEPSLAPYIPHLEYIAGALGITGLGHAAKSGTVKQFKTSSLAAAFTALAAAAGVIPALAPYAALLHQLSLILSSLALFLR